MACVLKVKDPVLKKLLSKTEFQTLQEFEDEIYNTFVIKNTPFPTESIHVTKDNRTITRNKFGRIIQLDGDRLSVSLALPQGEDTDKFRFNLKDNPDANVYYQKYAIEINPIIDKKGNTRPDLDTLTTLWLGNLLTINSDEDLVNKVSKEFPDLFQKIITQLTKFPKTVKTGFNKAFIEKVVDLFRTYEQVAIDRNLPIEYSVDIDPLIDQVLNLVQKDKPEVEKYKEYTTKEDAQRIQEEEEIEQYNKETQVQDLVDEVSFLVTDTMNPIPPDPDLGENIPLARTILLESIKNSNTNTNQFRVRVVRGQVDFVQPRIKDRWLTTEEVIGKDSPTVVGIVEMKVGEEWKPVFLKGTGDISLSNYSNLKYELTTDRTESKKFEYNVGETESISDKLYFQVRPDIREDFKKGYALDPNYQPTYIVKRVEPSNKYITLNEAGFTLDNIFIENRRGYKGLGIPRVMTDNPEHFEWPSIQGLNSDEIKELIPLLQHTYTNKNDLDKAIVYLNKLISIGEFNTIEGNILPYDKTYSQKIAITRRVVSFYPNEDGTRILTVVERIKVGDSYSVIPREDQQAILYEDDPDLIQNGLETAIVNIPKSNIEGKENKVGVYPARVIIEEGKLKVSPWPIKDQVEWLGNKIKTRLKKVEGKIINPHLSLVIYKNSPVKIEPNPNELDLRGFKVTKNQPISNIEFRTNMVQRFPIELESYLGQFYQVTSNDLSAQVIFTSPEEIIKILGRPGRAVYTPDTNTIFFNFDFYSSSSNQENDLFRIYLEESIHELTVQELGKEGVQNSIEYQRLQEVRTSLIPLIDEYLNTIQGDKNYVRNLLNYYLANIEEFSTSITVGRMVHFMNWASDNNKLEYERDIKQSQSLVSYITGILKKILAKLLEGKGLTIQVVSDVLSVAYKQTTPISEEVSNEFITDTNLPELENLEDSGLPKDFLDELKDFKGIKKKTFGAFSPSDISYPIKGLDMLASKVLFENKSEDNATFGDFVNGNVVTGTLWGGMMKSLYDEYNNEETSQKRKDYILKLINDRKNLLREWQNNSRLFKFSKDTDKVKFNEESVEEDQEDDLNESNEGDSKFADRTEQTASSFESGDKYAKIFVKMTPKVKLDKNGNPQGLELDENGNLVPADFTGLWNSIADMVANSLSIEEMIEKMRGRPKMQEIKIVLERLESLKSSITDTIILNAFQKSFSKYLVPTIIVESTRTEKGLEYRYLPSGRLDGRKIEDSIAQGFREFAEDNDFLREYQIVVDGSNQVIQGVNFDKLYKKVKSLPNKQNLYSREELISFWREIGMTIPDTAKEDTLFYNALNELTRKLLDRLETVTNIFPALNDIQITMSDLNLIEFIKKDQQYSVNNNLNTIAGEPTIVNRVTELLSSYLPFSTSNMTKNAEGKNQSNLHNFSTWLETVKFLNEGQTDKVWRLQNPITKYSLVYNELISGRTVIKPVNLSGTVNVEGEDRSGTNTISLGLIDYLRQEFFTLLSEGVKENLRAETANTSFGFQVNYGVNQKLPIPTNEFKSLTYLDKLKPIYEDYLRGELERIQQEKNSNYQYWPGYNSTKENFSLFKDILTLDSKNILLDNIDNIEEGLSQINLRDDLEIFFNRELANLKNWISNETGMDLTGSNPIFDSIKNQISQYGLDAVLKSFLINGSIISTEEVILFHGELGMFNKFYKRSKSNISNGTPVIINQRTRRLLEQKGNTFSELTTGELPVFYTTSIQKSIVAQDDNKTISDPESFILAIQESLEETSELFGQEKPDKQAGEKKAQKYLEGSVVSDGDAWIHPDAYRMFLLGTSSWSSNQEEGFKYLVFKEKQRTGILTQEEQNHINYVNSRIEKEGYYFQFPKIKFQYRGGSRKLGETSVSNIELLDKFALTPLFPDLVRGKVGEPILNQMTKEGIAYGKFSTGTKVGTYQLDDLLNQVRSGNLEPVFESTHEILLDYFKEQVKTPNSLKLKNIFGSQVRKLTISNLSLDGHVMAPFLKDVNQWKDSQKGLAENERRKIIEELGGDPNDSNPTIDRQKFVDLLNEELKKRELPKAFTDIFHNFQEEDNFEEALSPQIIETLLYSVLKNRIVKAKFPGGQLIQISSPLFDSIENRDLEFYRKVDGKILPADCKVTLSGDFLNLLNLKEVRDLISTGLEPQDALNQLLKDDSFRQKYDKQLTIFSYRIPTQGYNSMDVFLVKEFLPPYMGDSIVLPPEITTKSGTDYDYDKASVVLPSISKSGQYINEEFLDSNDKVSEKRYNKLYDQIKNQLEIIKSPEFQASLRLFGEEEADLAELIESKLVVNDQLITKEEFIQEIRDSFRNKVNYNRVIESAQGILLNPINFARLVTPNTVEDIYPIIEGILNKLEISRREPRDTSVISYLTHLKKWQAVKIKDLLGINAVGNTFYTLMQEVGQRLNETIEIYGNTFNFTLPLLTEEERKQASISNPYIVGQTIDKLEIINQFINLTVDAASDDIAGYLNLLKDNMGFVLFQTMLGVPLDRIFNLIHQPVVYKYHQIVNEGLTSGLSLSDSKKKAYQTLFQIRPSKLNFNGQEQSKNMSDYWKEIALIEIPEHFDELEITTRGEINSYKINKSDRQILSYYLQGLQQAEALREAQSYLNFDTKTSPSYLYSAQRETVLADINRTGLFNLEDIQKIKKNSVISHLDVHNLFRLLSANLFSFKRDDPYVNEVVRLSKQVYENKDTFMRVFDNDFLMFIAQNFGDKKEVDRVKSLLIDGKLVKEWNRLKKKYPQLENYSIGKKLIANFSKETRYTNPQFFMGLDQDVDEYDQIADEIRRMLKGANPEFVSFAQNLITVGFYQTGFNQSPVYLMKALPFEEVRKYLKPAYTKYQELSIDQQQLVINDFSQDFLMKRARQFGRFFVSEYRDMGLNFDDIRRTAVKEPWRFLDYRRILDLENITFIEPVSNSPSIPMQPDNIEKIDSGRKTITNRTIKIADGIYQLPNGKEVQLILLGQAKVTNGTVKLNDKVYGNDKFAQEEGFLNWNDFVENNKFSKNFINGNQSRFVYSISLPNRILSQITFQEDQSTGYAERTKKNASADATIAIAIDFTSAGEKLTHKSVQDQGKLYLPVNADELVSENDIQATAGKISQLISRLGKKSITLNIAGNGIYTLNQKVSYTQSQVDRDTLELLTAVKQRLDEKGIQISLLRTGGQTGYDEAGAKAGIALGIPSLILAPKGWKFRDINKKDISDEQAFKARFGNTQQVQQGQLSLFEPIQEEYSYTDLAIENVGKKVSVQYEKHTKSFEGIITGQVQEVGRGSDEKGDYIFVGVEIQSNTGKLLTANPFYEIKGITGVEKLTKNSNKIYIPIEPIVYQEEKEVDDCNSHTNTDDIPF